MRPTFDRFPPKLMIEVQICMWSKMMPRRGLPEYPASISAQALALLESEADHMFILVLCLYVVMDWKKMSKHPLLTG